MLSQTTINTLISLLSLSAAHPLSTLVTRAGAPIAKPIPSTCTIDNPLLCTSAAYCPPVSRGTPIKPNSTVMQSNGTDGGALLYGYYLDPSSPAVVNGNDSSLLTQCLETCYGYGYTGDCQGVYQARNYPAPPMYGAPGGQLTVACLLFARQLTGNDFKVVSDTNTGNYTDAVARNIECPSS